MYGCLVLILVYCIALWTCSSEATHGFTAYPIQRFDLQGFHIGSKATALDCEAQTYFKQMSRKCLLLGLSELPLEDMTDASFHNVLGIIVILPSRKWSAETRKTFMNLEQHILSTDFTFPMYFVLENRQLNNVRTLLKRAESNAVSGISTFIDSIWSTGFRFVIQSSQPKVLENVQITNLMSYLNIDNGQKLPALMICAHYDALTAIPSFSYGMDSSGSGVVVLLELARIFGRIFAHKFHRPRYDMIFLLSGGGNYNYLGTKYWLDQNVEDANGLALLDSVIHVICLEGLGSGLLGADLHAHLSRPPRNGSFSERFLGLMNQSIARHRLSAVISNHSKNLTGSVRAVHKKINLNQGSLDWEHERFSIHRLPSLTLSSWPSLQVANQWRHNSLDGGSLYNVAEFAQMFGNRSTFYGHVSPVTLARNIRVIAEALAHVLFDKHTDEEGMSDTAVISPQWITETGVSSLLDLLARNPRSIQLLTSASQEFIGTTLKTSPTFSPMSSNIRAQIRWPGLLGSLEYVMKNFVQNVRQIHYPLLNGSQRLVFESWKDSSSTSEKEKRTTDFDKTRQGGQSLHSTFLASSAALNDVELVLYSGVEPKTLVIYSLKSSAFDLMVAVAITCYLGSLHIFLEHSQGMRRILKLGIPPSSKTQ